MQKTANVLLTRWFSSFSDPWCTRYRISGVAGRSGLSHTFSGYFTVT